MWKKGAQLSWARVNLINSGEDSCNKSRGKFFGKRPYSPFFSGVFLIMYVKLSRCEFNYYSLCFNTMVVSLFFPEEWVVARFLIPIIHTTKHAFFSFSKKITTDSIGACSVITTQNYPLFYMHLLSLWLVMCYSIVTH